MRFKQLLLAGLLAASTTTSALADPPYIAAVIVDDSPWAYYYRPTGIGPLEEYSPSATLVSPAWNPYTWQTGPSLQIQVDPDTEVTYGAWWAIEEWSNTPYYHCVYKNNYAQSVYPFTAQVPDHYSPINAKPLYVGDPEDDPSGNAHGQEVVTYPYYKLLVYVPRLNNYSNGYYLANGDGYSGVTVFIDGGYYITNG